MLVHSTDNAQHVQYMFSVGHHFFKHLFISLHVAGESSTVCSGDSRGKVIQAYAELQTKMWHKQAEVVQPIEIRVSL